RPVRRDRHREGVLAVDAHRTVAQRRLVLDPSGTVPLQDRGVRRRPSPSDPDIVGPRRDDAAVAGARRLWSPPAPCIAGADCWELGEAREWIDRWWRGIDPAVVLAGVVRACIHWEAARIRRGLSRVRGGVCRVYGVHGLVDETRRALTQR